MTLIAPTPQVTLEALPSYDEVLATVQGYFPDAAISSWDALNGESYNRDDQRTKLPGLGFMMVRAYGVDETGSVMREVEVNDSFRPFDEDVQKAMAIRAIENAVGADDTAIVVRGGSKKFSRTVRRILC